MEKLKGLAALEASSTAKPLVLPKSIPVLDADVVEGARRRSARARRLDAALQARAEEGRPLGERDVEKLVRGCTTPDGKPDADQAAVLAHHAQRTPRLFGGGHASILRFLARITWKTLVRDLSAFLARIREEEADARKREEIRQSIEDDRVDRDARRAAMKKTTAAHEQRKTEDLGLTPKDERLSADSRLQRTLERLKRS